MRLWSVLVACLVLTGCAGHSGATPPSASPSRSPEPSHTATPSPTSTPVGLPPAREPFWRTNLRDQLAADPTVRRELVGYEHPAGPVLCGLHLLGANGDRSVRYARLLCASYRTGPDAKELSGGASGVVLHLTGSGQDLRLTGVDLPRQQSVESDIHRLFPRHLVDVVQSGRVRTSPTEDQLLQLARSLPAEPPCVLSQLYGRAPRSGDPAGGTFYSGVRLTNDGPACLLLDATLTLWAGADPRPVASLDLDDVHGRRFIALPAGSTLDLWAIVPAQRCFGRSHGLAPLWLADSTSSHPTKLGGSREPRAYARCGGVQLIEEAPGGAPSP